MESRKKLPIDFLPHRGYIIVSHARQSEKSRNTSAFQRTSGQAPSRPRRANTGGGRASRCKSFGLDEGAPYKGGQKGNIRSEKARSLSPIGLSCHIGDQPMTVGIGIKCSDGIVLACDSLATMSRGVPVMRYDNKIQIIEHDKLEFPIIATSAGMTTFSDKFRERAQRQAIEDGCREAKKDKLDVVDFCELVCEPVVAGLLKEYLYDRSKFLGTVADYSLNIIIAGATRDGELRAYHVFSDGLTESIEHYGTIGSGAAYAELYLRYLIANPNPNITLASRLAVYAIKGVELMDPFVAGDTNIMTVKMSANKKSLIAKLVPQTKIPNRAKNDMEKVLKNISTEIGKVIVPRKKRVDATRKTQGKGRGRRHEKR